MTLPRLVGDGPATCSTSIELDVFPRIIWDTNRYYADLGVDVRASKKQIKQAYQRRRGHESQRLTYITKQLLDPDVRRRYDATPPGSLFFDYYVETMQRRARVQKVSRLRRQGRVAEAEAIEADDDETVVDTAGATVLNGAEQPEAATDWPYAFYLWGSVTDDRDRLRRWQHAIVRVLGGQREHHQIAVGFVGGQGCEFDRVGYRLVFFLGDEEQPDDALAQRVVSHFQSNERIEIKKCQDRSSARVAMPLPKQPRAGATSPRPTSSASKTGSRLSSAS